MGRKSDKVLDIFGIVYYTNNTVKRRQRKRGTRRAKMIKSYHYTTLGWKSRYDLVANTFDTISKAKKECIRLKELGYDVSPISQTLIGKLNTAEYDRRGNKLPPRLTPGV